VVISKRPKLSATLVTCLKMPPAQKFQVSVVVVSVVGFG
jgi:hypothetical protein